MLKKLSVMAVAMACNFALAADPPANAKTITIPGKGVMQRWSPDPRITTPTVVQKDRVAVATATAATQLGADTTLCSASEFRSSSSSGTASASHAVLVGRHKYCQEYQTTPTVLSVDLMKRTQNSQWEYYRPGMNPFIQQTFNVGTLVLRSRMSAFGAGDRLAKTHKLDVDVQSFAFDNSFPAHLRPGVSLKLFVDGGAMTNFDSDIQNFTIGVGTIQPITLNGSTASGSTGAFDVTFDWSFAGGDPMENIARIAVFAPRYKYQFNDTPPAGTSELFSFSADSSASWLHAQWLRCDKGVASGDGAPAQGCVFESAAPIFNISAIGPAAEEAVHIYQAQRSRDAYKTKLSPGVFKPMSGTRAVADESGGDQFAGLTRGLPPDASANRAAACEATNSLFNSRPYSGSLSCPSPASAPCDCDEFPMAITKDGGAFNPLGTSVRRINLSQNRSGGAQLQNFFRSHRVIPGEKFWVNVTDFQ